MKKLVKGLSLLALVLLFTCLSFSASYADRDSSPAAKWLLDGNVLDSSGNGNNGDLSGALYTIEGIHKQGLAFEFHNFIEVQDSPFLNFGTGNFSISLWLKVEHRYVLRGLVDKTDENMIGYTVSLDYGKITFQMGDSQGTTNYLHDEYLDYTGWRNVVVTVSRGINNRVRIYLDGVKVEEFNNPRLGSVNNTRPLLIADSYYGNNFYGYLDEIMIYNNQELTPEEVQEIHMNESCTGKWNMDGNGNDSSGNFNNGTLNGNPPPETTGGVHDWALRFNGSNFITVPDHETLDQGTNPFTISFWVSSTSARSLNTIIDKRTRNGANYTGYLVALYNGRPFLQLADGTGWYNFYPTTGPYCNDGQGHFVMIRVDRPPHNVDIHIDGQHVANFDSANIPGSLTNTSDFYIGRHFETPANNFVGTLDEVKIYNKILSATEEAEQYNCNHRL
jgi:hypothetical protein